jgi:hypothetical protein
MDWTVERIVAVTALADCRVGKQTEFVQEAVWMDGQILTAMKVYATHSHRKFGILTTTPSTGQKVDQFFASMRIKR